MSTRHLHKPRIAITIGDPAGIGPEITIKALAKLGQLADFLLVGDFAVVKPFLKSGCRVNFVKEDKILFKNGFINIWDIGIINDRPIVRGKFDKLQAKAFLVYIEKAARLALLKKIDALVTAPINKEAAKRVGFTFPGHTEYLAHLTGTKVFGMMLIGCPLRVTLVTRHLALKDVSKNLSKKDIINTTVLTHNALKRYFKIKSPNIGVAGLNPHAGDSGMFGNEEGSIIRPAVRYLNTKLKNIHGPIPADALFRSAYNGRYDAVICMYHDQGLIPLKMIARDKGVNLTLGLPFVRTSPDHGTAYDIAAKGTADPSSMIEAIRLACELSKNTRAC